MNEASAVPRTVELALEPGDLSVYIFTEGVLAFPVDKRTPLEAIGKGYALSIHIQARQQKFCRGGVRGGGLCENVAKVRLHSAAYCRPQELSDTNWSRTSS